MTRHLTKGICALSGALALIGFTGVWSDDVSAETFYGCLSNGGNLNNISTDPNTTCSGNKTLISLTSGGLTGPQACPEGHVVIGVNSAGQLECAIPGGRTIAIDCDLGETIGAALATGVGRTSDILEVSGSCSENITIARTNVRLVAIGGASIDGPDTSRPTIRVIGARARITGFTLTGGSNVIQVQNGGSATILSNDISGASSSAGILLTQNSYGQIGTSATTGNNIHNNPRGIIVRLGSGADIFFNTIDSNDRGIDVNAGGSVDMADNTISNSTRGLNIFTNGHATLSSTPATTGGPNVFTNNGTAIRCRNGGSANTGNPANPQTDGGGNGILLDVGAFNGPGGCHVSNSVTF